MPPAVVLPQPDRQPRRLLDIATPLPPVEGNGNAQRWLEGVTWNPRDCSTMTYEYPDLCGDDHPGPGALLQTIGCEDWGESVPFRVSQLFTQTVLNFPNKSYAEQRLQENYETQVSAAFAGQLVDQMSAVAYAPTQGQAFADTAVTVDVAVGILESTIASRLHGGVGYLHIPPLLLGRAMVTAGLHFEGDRLRTPAGNIVISDAGYDNAFPPTGGAVTELCDWIYCSGEVFVAKTVPELLDPTFGDATSSANNRTPWEHNTYEQWISGYGILVFDTCPVSAVKATVVG